MDINQIKDLIESVSNSEIAELELEMENIKLRIAKSSGQSVITQSDTHNSELTMVGSPKPAPPEPEVLPENVVEVCSPMVGTFYRAPSPTSDPFVIEGNTIKKGQALCIIEAMKLMNEIESEHTGKLHEVLVENGQAVEYGQPLFLVELTK